MVADWSGRMAVAAMDSNIYGSAVVVAAAVVAVAAAFLVVAGWRGAGLLALVRRGC